MFRQKQDNSEKFGKGSVLIAGEDRYLVYQKDNKLGLINLKTFSVNTRTLILVEDVNHITHDEAMALADLLGLNWSQSDYDFDAKGLK